MSAIESTVQCVKVDDLSTPSVDDNRILWKERQFTRADQVAGFSGQLRDKHKDMAHREHGVEVGHHFHVREARNPRIDIGIVSKHRAIERILELACDLRADIAKTHDAHGLTFKLNDR